MSRVREKYDLQWQNRLSRETSHFLSYSRNRIVVDFFRPEERFLDLACGDALVGEYAQRKYSNAVRGLDISSAAVERARASGVDALIGSLEEPLPFDDQSFDTVFWGDNIEHTFFIVPVMREIHRVLTQQGRLLISTPNQAYWYYRIYTFLTGRLPRTEGENYHPWEWNHIRFFTCDILCQLFAQTGFRMTQVKTTYESRFDRVFGRMFPLLCGRILVVEARKDSAVERFDA